MKSTQMTIERARQILDDFVLVVHRTKWLYVTVAQHREELPPDLRGDLPEEHSLGYFEPVTLCFCWFDFLGALYSGSGERDNRGRVVTWLRFMGEEVNPKYARYAEDLYRYYRNFLVHQYCPGQGGFGYNADGYGHLDLLPNKELFSEDRVPYLDVPTLLDDLTGAIARFRKTLTFKPLVPESGSLEAFGKPLGDLGWNLEKQNDEGSYHQVEMASTIGRCSPDAMNVQGVPGIGTNPTQPK